MKNLIQYIVVAFMFLFSISCSNSFLMEELEITSWSETTIVLSPHGEVQDYPIYYPNAGNAAFTVTNAPAWLDIRSKSGQFHNDIASLNCKATVNSDFSEVGFYNALITLDVANKGKLTVPITYVNEGNPVIEADNSVTIDYNQQSYFSIRNKGKGILLWNVKECPTWISIIATIQALPTGLISQYEEHRVYLTLNTLAIPENNGGKIVIASNDKTHPEIVVDVAVMAGNPVLDCFVNEIDFGRKETTRSLDMSNQGNGLLIWHFEDFPEWLSISETNGVLSMYEPKGLILTCDRNRLPADENSAVIKLISNDKNRPVYFITVKARNIIANAANIETIEGTVVDAWLDKNTDLLYLATSQPNKLLAYDTHVRKISREVNLSYAPTCFSVSEEGRKAIVGHGGWISSVDLDNFSILKTLEVDSDIFDIEWGIDDWCCYTPNMAVQHCPLSWVNLITGEKTTSSSIYNYLYGGTLIKKIPHQDYVIASRLYINPSGISVFDTQTKESGNYFHESINTFWFSSDGAYLFDSSCNVYRTSSLLVPQTNLSVSPISQLKYSSYSSLIWLDHHATTNHLWIVPQYNGYDPNAGKILQLEANDYTLLRTYAYDNDYLINGVEYPVQAHYVFANGTGTELTVIRNVSDSYVNAWSLEFIPVIN